MDNNFFKNAWFRIHKNEKLVFIGTEASGEFLDCMKTQKLFYIGTKNFREFFEKYFFVKNDWFTTYKNSKLNLWEQWMSLLNNIK